MNQNDKNYNYCNSSSASGNAPIRNVTQIKRPRLSPAHSSTSESSASSEDYLNDLEIYINQYSTDIELLTWQEHQVDMCIVENSVNRVVETYRFLNNRSIPTAEIDVEEESNRPPPGFEESAILMAINEHGLQQNPIDNNEENISSINQFAFYANELSQSVTESGDTSNIGSSFNDQHSADIILSTDHVDFMEAAVAAAIQKKGLISCGSNLSPTR